MADLPGPSDLYRISSDRPTDAELIPPERDVSTGRPVQLDRSDKRRHPDQQRPTHRVPQSTAPRTVVAAAPQFWRRPLTIAAAGVGTVAIILAAVLIPRLGSSGTTASAGGDPASVSATTTPASTVPAGVLSVPVRPVASTGVGSSVATTPSGSRSVAPPQTTARQSSTTTSERTASSSAAPTARPLTGYRMTWRITQNLGTLPPGSHGFPIGTSSVEIWRCTSSQCSGKIAGVGLLVTFAVGAARVHYVHVFAVPKSTVPQARCEPTTATMDLTRQADGRYTGTVTQLPHKFHDRVDFGGGAYSECWSPGWKSSVTGVPL